MIKKQDLCNLSVCGRNLLIIEEETVKELVLLIQIAGVEQCNCIATISHQLKKMLFAHQHSNPDTPIHEVIHDWQDFIDIKIGDIVISLTIDDIKKLAMMSIA